MSEQATKLLVLPAILDLDSLDGVRDGLIDAVDAGAVVIRANTVERLATNALFMLMSAAETARRNHFEFVIASPSAAMLAAIDRLGLRASFEGMIRE